MVSVQAGGGKKRKLNVTKNKVAKLKQVLSSKSCHGNNVTESDSPITVQSPERKRVAIEFTTPKKSAQDKRKI